MPTVYQRIMRAAEQDSGLRLSPEDVGALAMEAGIVEAAERDDESLSYSISVKSTSED